MLRRALASRFLAAGLMLGVIGLAAESQAASVLLATIPPPVPGAAAINQALDGLNAAGASLATGVTDLGKVKLDKPGDLGNSEILYFTLKPGRDTQLFGFFDEKGNQIALLPGDLATLASTDDISKASLYGRQRPIPEPASVLLLLAGGALVVRATRKSRTSKTA